MRFFDSLKGLFEGGSRPRVSQEAILAEYQLIPPSILPGSTETIREMAKERLIVLDEKDDVVFEMLDDLGFPDIFGIPEATILTVVVLYKQLRRKLPHQKSLEVIDSLRVPPLLISVDREMSLESYLRLRIYQELHNERRPQLTHPEWRCAEGFFEAAISKAETFWDGHDAS